MMLSENITIFTMFFIYRLFSIIYIIYIYLCMHARYYESNVLYNDNNYTSAIATNRVNNERVLREQT